jgi:hypothetical protein
MATNVVDRQVKFALFPNPVRDNKITLQVFDKGPTRVEFLDIVGNMFGVDRLMGELKYVMNISGLPTGISIMRIYTNDGTFIHKIIKQ